MTTSGMITVGIDMGATHIRGARYGSDGSASDPIRLSIPKGLRDRERLPLEIAARLAPGAAAVGLAIAGVVSNGRLVHSANIGLRDVDYAKGIWSVTGLPVSVVNDAQAAGVAESNVSARSRVGVAAMVTIGTGIGGAVMIDGQLIVGRGAAGEVGHMIVDRGGRQCPCGNKGCWETLASGSALQREAVAFGGQETTVASLVAAAEEGNTAAIDAIDRCAEGFADGLVALCAALSPSTVILGGGVMARGGLLADRYLESAGARAWVQGASLVRASLGDESGAMGAAIVARQHQAEALRAS